MHPVISLNVLLNANTEHGRLEIDPFIFLIKSDEFEKLLFMSEKIGLTPDKSFFGWNGVTRPERNLVLRMKRFSEEGRECLLKGRLNLLYILLQNKDVSLLPKSSLEEGLISNEED